MTLVYSAVATSFRRLLCSFVSLALLPASAVAQRPPHPKGAPSRLGRNRAGPR